MLDRIIEGATLERLLCERKVLQPEIAAVAVRSADAADLIMLRGASPEYAEAMSGRRKRAPTACHARPRRR